ncbi:MAG: DUF4118 domain-containing protein [Betaproteobacteria bacterium]|nr:DUF4118 domain-containing protein [Betaproteobacteria bacterium]
MNTDLSMPTTRAASPKGYGWALLACVFTTVIATPLIGHIDLANIVMLFLLTVLLVAAYVGRGPAVLAAFLSVALFDFFFVPPRFTFSVDDPQYLVTFVVMLAVALVTGQLTAGLRQQADVASAREKRTQALYEMARSLAGALTIEQVSGIVRQSLPGSLELDVILLLPDKTGKLKPTSPLENQPQLDQLFELMSFEQGEPVEDYSVSGYGYGAGYFPLKAPTKCWGVIAFIPNSQHPDALRGQTPLLATIASVVAIAVERLHYVEAAQACNHNA